MWLERYDYIIIFNPFRSSPTGLQNKYRNKDIMRFSTLMMASKSKTPGDCKNLYRYIVSNKNNALATILIPRVATYIFNLVY